jgi:hypothetical protein
MLSAARCDLGPVDLTISLRWKVRSHDFAPAPLSILGHAIHPSACGGRKPSTGNSRTGLRPPVAGVQMPGAVRGDLDGFLDPSTAPGSSLGRYTRRSTFAGECLAPRQPGPGRVLAGNLRRSSLRRREICRSLVPEVADLRGNHGHVDLRDSLGSVAGVPIPGTTKLHRLADDNSKSVAVQRRRSESSIADARPRSARCRASTSSANGRPRSGSRRAEASPPRPPGSRSSARVSPG